jgi:hypothetical protein
VIASKREIGIADGITGNWCVALRHDMAGDRDDLAVAPGGVVGDA